MEPEQIRTQFEQTLNSKDRQILTFQKEVLKTKRANQSLREEKETLLQNIKTKESLIADLERQKLEAETLQKVTSLDSTTYKREAQIYDDFLKSTLSKSDLFIQAIKQLDNELKGNLTKVNDLDRHNLILSNENTSFKTMDELYAKKEEVYKSTINKLFEDMDLLRSTFQTRTTDLEYRLEAEQRENGTLRANQDAQNQKFNDLERSAKELHDNSNIEIQNYIRALTVVQSREKLLNGEIEKLSQELNSKSEALENKEIRVARDFELKSQQINAFSQEIQNLKLIIVEKDAQINRVREENLKIKARENLLNQGLEDFGAQRERLEQSSKEDLIAHIQEINQLYSLERSERQKVQTQFDDMRRELSEKIPLLLDKQAQFSRASEENENLKSRIAKVMDELGKVYKEKVSFETELKKLREESESETFQAAFLHNEITKLLIQNNKFKLAIMNGSQGDTLREMLTSDLEPADSVFYNDIDDLQKKHLLLVNRLNELKLNKRKEDRLNSSQNRKPISFEESYNEGSSLYEQEKDFIDSRRPFGGDIVEKRRKIDVDDIELKATKEAQDALIERLRQEAIDLSSKLRDSQQQIVKLNTEISSLHAKKKIEDSKVVSERIIVENSLSKAEFAESTISKLLDEKKKLNQTILEKDKAVNDLISKAQLAKRENVDLQRKIEIMQKELSTRDGYEERLNKIIRESQQDMISEDKNSNQSVSILKEETIALKTKIENQAVLIKNYEDRDTNLQRLLRQLSHQFKVYSNKLNSIFFEDEIQGSYNSSVKEVLALRGKLSELQETLAFYKQELNAQDTEYRDAFNQIEDMTNIITDNFASLRNKFSQQGSQIQEQLEKISNNYGTKVQDLQARVDTYLEPDQEEEEYEDNDWVHISEYQKLEGQLKKEEENLRTLKAAIDEMRNDLLQEREANLKHTSVQQNENEQVKQFILEIDNLTNTRVQLESTVKSLQEKYELQQQHLNLVQRTSEKEMDTLNNENQNLKADIGQLTDNLSQLTNENIESAGVVVLQQRNNLLSYLRERNSTLSLERDQLKSKLSTLKKKIDELKSEKIGQIGTLEKELIVLKRNQEFEVVPQTSYIKALLEENKTLFKENEHKKKLLTEQEQQIKVFEQFGRVDEVEQEGSSPLIIEEDDENFLTAEKVLSLLEKAKAQYEVLGRIEGKDQKE